METTIADSPKNTQLKDRILWYDGDSSVTEESLIRAIERGQSTEGLFVESLTPMIEKYNQSVSTKSEKIGIKTGIRDLEYTWNIPEEYKEIDVKGYIIDKLIDQTKDLDEEERDQRELRCVEEVDAYERLGFIEVLAALIYIINTLIENNVVWGVGRGSSVSSYILYLIGVHDIDSFKYGLDISEFLRTS